MKKNILLLSSLFSFCALPANAAEILWNGTFNDGANPQVVRFDKTAVWTGSQTPTINDNLYFNYDAKGGIFSTVVSGGFTVNARDVTYNLTGMKQNDWGKNFNSLLLLGTDANFNISNNLTFNITKDPAETKNMWIRITNYSTGIVVSKDVILNANAATYLRFDQEWFENGRFATTTIKGDLINKNNGNFVFSNLRTVIEGVIRAGTGTVNLCASPTSDNANKPPNTSQPEIYSFGGIEGTGKLVMTKINDATASIVFTNAGTSEFKGSFQMNAESVGKLNVTMNGSGRQIFRLSSAEATIFSLQNNTNVNISDGAFALITAKSGRIDVCTNNKNVGTLNIAGGTFSAIGMDSEAGTFAADKVDWSAGKIVVDITQNSCDLIDIAQTLTLSEGVKTFEFSLTAGDIAAWGIDGVLERNLMFFAANSAITKDDIATILVKTNANVSAELFAIMSGEEIFGIGAKFTVIPEPSTIAALAALLATAFAIARRRR